MNKIRIDRKGHYRRSYVRKGKRIKGTYVNRSIYLKKDIGKPGRGKPIIPKTQVKTGILGKGFFEKPLRAQKARIRKQVKRRGERYVQGQLQYIGNIHTNTKIKKRAKRLRSWTAKSFGNFPTHLDMLKIKERTNLILMGSDTLSPDQARKKAIAELEEEGEIQE